MKLKEYFHSMSIPEFAGSLLIPIFGFVIYFMNVKDNKLKAEAGLSFALIGCALILIIWYLVKPEEYPGWL